MPTAPATAITDQPTPTDPAVLSAAPTARSSIRRAPRASQPPTKRGNDNGKGRKITAPRADDRGPRRWKGTAADCRSVDLYDLLAVWGRKGRAQFGNALFNGLIFAGLVVAIIAINWVLRAPQTVDTTTAAIEMPVTDQPPAVTETAPAVPASPEIIPETTSETTPEAAEDAAVAPESATSDEGSPATEANPTVVEMANQETPPPAITEPVTTATKPQKKPMPLPAIVDGGPYNEGGAADLDNHAARQRYQELNLLTAHRGAPAAAAAPVIAPTPAAPIATPAASKTAPAPVEPQSAAAAGNGSDPVPPAPPAAGNEKTLKDLELGYQRPARPTP